MVPKRQNHRSQTGHDVAQGAAGGLLEHEIAQLLDAVPVGTQHEAVEPSPFTEQRPWRGGQ